MATNYNPKVVIDNLVLSLDAGNPKNYNVGVSTNWVDKVGGNNGTLYGGTNHNDGPFVGAGYVEFDGTGDNLSISSTSSLGGFSGDFTIEFWFKGGNQNVYAVFLESWVSFTNSTQKWAIQAEGSGPTNMIWVRDGLVKFTTSGIDVFDNAWHHHAVVRDGSTITYYIDGVSRGSETHSAALTPGTDFIIGEFSTGNFEIEGYLSNVRIVEGTAIYTSAFTPPTKSLTAVPGTKLLTCQGNTITDASSSAHTITASGDITLTKEPFTGAGAVEFDGTDYLTIADTATDDLEFGSGDFTIEAYIYPTGVPSSFGYACIFAKGAPLQCYFMNSNSLNSINALSLFVDTNNDGTPYSIIDNNSVTGNNTVNQDEWTHIAICRSGDTWKVFTGGVQRYSATHSGAIFNNTDVFSIGDYGPNSGLYPFQGYISNFRVIKGTALYTSAFTPPTRKLDPIENTALLTCQGQNIKDYSSIAHAITVNGDPKPTIVSSSFEFDGTNDYIQLPASSDLDFGTGNFTLEGWFNKSATTTLQVLLCSNKYYINGNNGNWILRISSATQIAFAAYDGTSNTNLEYTEFSASTSVDTWHHFALVREGTGTNETKFYLDGVLKGSMTVSKSLTDAGTNGLRIGEESDSGPGNAPFNGKISNIKIYKGKGFTAAEVLQNYNATKGRYEF